jgi:hypothetical protein
LTDEKRANKLTILFQRKGRLMGGIFPPLINLGHFSRQTNTKTKKIKLSKRMKTMKKDNPISRLFEDVFGNSRKQEKLIEKSLTDSDELRT